MKNVKFFLHICTHDCDCASPTEKSVKVFGKEYPVNFRDKIDIDYKINDNKLTFEIPEIGSKPSLGEAEYIESIVIRMCDGKASVQALYSDMDKTAMAACCNAGGCSCYASGGCSC